MSKTLCDWSKSDLEKKAGKLAEIVRDPRFYCRKCARSAHKSKNLCKPRQLPSIGENDVPKHKNFDTGD